MICWGVRSRSLVGFSLTATTGQTLVQVVHWMQSQKEARLSASPSPPGVLVISASWELKALAHVAGGNFRMSMLGPPRPARCRLSVDSIHNRCRSIPAGQMSVHRMHLVQMRLPSTRASMV